MRMVDESRTAAENNTNLSPGESRARNISAQTGDWVCVGPAADIPLNRAQVVPLAELRVAVFRCAGHGFFAVEDRCPHRGAPLSQGVIYEDTKLACLDHGWGICLRTGRVEAPATGTVRTFEVKVEDGVVWLNSAGA
jgi:nitrite reductase (NADH) small subunit